MKRCECFRKSGPLIPRPSGLRQGHDCQRSTTRFLTPYRTKYWIISTRNSHRKRLSAGRTTNLGSEDPWLRHIDAFIWYADGSSQLSRLHGVLTHPSSELYLSASVFLGDRAEQYGKGELGLSMPPAKYVSDMRRTARDQIVTHRRNGDFRRIARLPDIHRDPFDRIMDCSSDRGRYGDCYFGWVDQAVSGVCGLVRAISELDFMGIDGI